VISKEIEIYEHNLQSYCDIEEEDLIEMEPWEIPSVLDFNKFQFLSKVSIEMS
jgi:hypothetical protein